jgi:protein TonB
LRSDYEWQSHLNIYLRYPQDAIDNEKMGKVIVEITVDENGNAIDYTVAESAFPSLDEESIRVTKLFNPEFLPAEKDGRRVKIKVRQPIVFRIETDG